MPQIVRTDQAEIDLIEILVYLRGQSPKAADQFEGAIEEKCRMLAQFPRQDAPVTNCLSDSEASR